MYLLPVFYLTNYSPGQLFHIYFGTFPYIYFDYDVSILINIWNLCMFEYGDFFLSIVCFILGRPANIWHTFSNFLSICCVLFIFKSVRSGIYATIWHTHIHIFYISKVVLIFLRHINSQGGGIKIYSKTSIYTLAQGTIGNTAFSST